MTLTLRAVSLNDHPLTQPIAAHFDAEGGSIGRADHNTLALPDPERLISRQQAEISASGSGYVIKNVGSANPITVSGQALARGESAPLVHCDEVRIGGYLLEVIHEDVAGAEAATVVRGRAAVDAATPGAVRRAALSQSSGMTPRTSPPSAAVGLGDLSAPLSRSNPFANLLHDPPLGPVSPSAPTPVAPGVRSSQPPVASSEPLADPFFNPQPAASGVSPSSAAWAVPAVAPGRALLPDDFDPFATPPPRAAPVPTHPSGASAFEDLIPSTASESIDQMFNLSSAQRDPLADFMADLAPAPPAAGAEAGAGVSPLSTDPLALFGFTKPDATPPNALPAHSDHVPELRGAFVPPAIRPMPSSTPAATAPRGPVPEAPPVARPPSSQYSDPWSGDPHALWAAFCDGADVAIEPPQGVNPELMRVVGQLLRAAVAGTLQLMTVRATAKHELRAQVTMIQARNNNPLKFSPDARSALEQLLQPPMRGFLAGPAAMTDAMHDLVGHTIGTMAGMRAALEGVLDRFTPQQLEAKLAGKSMLDSVLPMNRKAKLWELYLQHFDAIRNDAHDDFHSLFGRAFLAAYEQQLDRLQREEPGKS